MCTWCLGSVFLDLFVFVVAYISVIKVLLKEIVVLHFFYYLLSFPAKSNVDDNWNELICIPIRRHLNKYILTNPLSSFQVIYVYILAYT